MKPIIRLILLILGVVAIIYQLADDGDYYGNNSRIWGVLLGIGLIVSPYTAIDMFIFYILFIGIPLGFAILGLTLGKEFFGQGFVADIAGFAGFVLGGKFVVSDAFNKLSALSIRRRKDRDLH